MAFPIPGMPYSCIAYHFRFWYAIHAGIVKGQTGAFRAQRRGGTGADVCRGVRRSKPLREADCCAFRHRPRRRNASEDFECREARSRPDLRATELDLKRSLQNTSTRGLRIAYGRNPKCGRMRCEHSNPGSEGCATSPIRKIFNDKFQ
jgi:hypothetical protein